MKGELTKKQWAMLNIIIEYIDNKHIAPSIRELTKLSGLKSTATIHGYLERLKEKGYITWDETMPRTLQVSKIIKQEESPMLELKCKELYRYPMNIDMIQEFYDLGEAIGKRSAAVNGIYNNKDISPELRLRCMVQYNKEWHENTSEILARIRLKSNLENEEHSITYDLKNKEMIVVDLLKSEHDRLCKEHAYLVKVIPIK